MILSLEFSNWNIKPRVVSMDSVVVTFEATVVAKRAVALSTRDHGTEGNAGIGGDIYMG